MSMLLSPPFLEKQVRLETERAARDLRRLFQVTCGAIENQVERRMIWQQKPTKQGGHPQDIQAHN
jgi:hypothetical protein